MQKQHFNKGPGIHLDILAKNGLIVRSQLSLSKGFCFTLSGDETLLELIYEGMEAYAHKQEFPKLPLAFNSLTPFQAKVFMELLKVPFGKCTSYSELASRAGKQKAPRAVGNACGANPLPLFIPCHRVLAKDYSLGGFSCGLAIKQELLAFEEINYN